MSQRSYIVLAVVGVGLIALAFAASRFSLGFSRFFAAEPGVGEELPTSTPSPAMRIPAPSSGLCSPESQQVAVGVAAVLSTRTTSAQWFAPQGTPSEGSGDSFRVTYATPGAKQVTIQVPRTDGSQGVDSDTCLVTVLAP